MASLRQLPKGKWLVQVRRDGVEVSKTFISKIAAAKWARAKEVEIESGKLTKEMVNMPTLYDCLQRYRKNVTSKKRSKRNEGYLIDRIQREDFVDLALDEVKPHHIADMRDRRLQVVGAQNVRHEMGVLRHMFNIAIDEWGFQIENPMKKVKSPKQPEARSLRLSAAEKAKLYLRLADYIRGGSEFQYFIRWQIATGMRMGESLGLTWHDIDLERSFAFLPLTKNGRSRTVPLSPEAKDILLQLKINPFKPFEHINKHFITDHWHAFRKIAGIEKFHIHDLRRECITSLLERGLTIPEVATISGHSSWNMVKKYCVVDEQKIVEKLAALAAE